MLVLSSLVLSVHPSLRPLKHVWSPVHYFLPICTSEFFITMKKEFYGTYSLPQASLVWGLKGYTTTTRLTYQYFNEEKMILS